MTGAVVVVVGAAPSVVRIRIAETIPAGIRIDVIALAVLLALT